MEQEGGLSGRVTQTTKFEYLLNAMENAASQDRPSDHDYFGKRQAVLKYVADLERASPGASPDLS